MAKLLTTGQLAEELGVSPATVRAYASAGRIPAQLTPGGHRRFDRDQARRALGYDRRRPPSLARLRAARGKIAAAAARHGAHNVRVVGSVARHEEVPGSDVDLFVDMEPGRTLFDVAGLHDELEEILDTQVDVLTSGIPEPTRSRVLRDAQPL